MKLLILGIVIIESCYTVSDEQYAKLPKLFHYDDYDECMLMGDKALYCSLKYELQPNNFKRVPEVWKVIQELNADKFNYRRDHLRHWICVPRTCPHININDKNINLSKEINHCYDEKFKETDLTGIVTELKCDTNKPRYPIDWIDVIVGLLLIAYTFFVMYASLNDISTNENESKKEIPAEIKTRILSAFSIKQNWNRLKFVKNTPETQQFRVFQGVRFYNSLIVIFSHSTLFMTAGPIANTRYAETMHKKLISSILTAGTLCVGTNFFLASFLLTYNIYSTTEKSKMSFKMVISFFMNRCIRLLPLLFIRWLLAITWSRHCGDGPVWNFFTEEDFLLCRKNGWTNLLFLNTIINKYSMCLPVTWYLAQDTQFYLLTLIILWICKKYPKFLWPLLTILLTICVTGVFIENYVLDHPVILVPYVESVYNLAAYKGQNSIWHTKVSSYFGNPIPTIMGIAFGYLFYLDRDRSIFKKYKSLFTRKESTLIFPAFILSMLPGVLMMILKVKHHRLWVSFYLAIQRLIFHSSITLVLYSSSRRKQGISKSILEWSPSYILGRLSYSAYLIHNAVMLTRMGMSRTPVYINDFIFIITYLGELCATYLIALLLTLFIELPSTAMVKLLNNRKEDKTTNQEKKKKIK